MASVERFEDLVAWQKARELTTKVYKVTRGAQFAKDPALSSQMRRAAVSVMANIAEGFERDGRAEFPHFLSTAKASSGELRSHLYVALDGGYVDATTFRDLLALGEEVSRIISGLRASVQHERSTWAKAR